MREKVQKEVTKKILKKIRSNKIIKLNDIEKKYLEAFLIYLLQDLEQLENDNTSD